MSLLSSVRARLAALFGRGAADGADGDRDAARVCSVCGTAVPRNESCPLCGSTDFVRRGGESAAASDESPSAAEPSAVTEDAASHLRELREDE